MSSPTPNPNPQPPNSSSPRNPRAVFSRGEQISARVQRLEKTCSKIHQCQRWPTQKSIRAYQHSLLVPKIHVSPPPQPQGYFHWWGGQITRPREEELAEILAPALNAKVEFPVPVRKGWKSEETEGGGGKAGKNEEREGFELFSLLPTEIRTQIWESEIRRPKFIEAQVSTAYGKPAFVGHCTKRSPLLSACRESREIALGEKYESLACRLSFKEWWYNPGPHEAFLFGSTGRLDFVPERDTIFFRSTDSPAGGLKSLASQIYGIENIQHVALSFESNSLSLRMEWKRILVTRFPKLKTLTWMLGGKDQSWIEDREIVLRDLEEWYADGREREMLVESTYLLDVSEVGKYMSGNVFDMKIRGRGKPKQVHWGVKPGWKGTTDWKGLNVRVVAWLKEGSRFLEGLCVGINQH